MMMMKFQNDFLNLISFVYFRFEKKQNKTKNWYSSVGKYNSQISTTSNEGKIVDGDGSMDMVFSILTKTLIW